MAQKPYFRSRLQLLRLQIVQNLILCTCSSSQDPSEYKSNDVSNPAHLRVLWYFLEKPIL